MQWCEPHLEHCLVIRTGRSRSEIVEGELRSFFTRALLSPEDLGPSEEHCRGRRALAGFSSREGFMLKQHCED
jgi:hypothetical protein